MTFQERYAKIVERAQENLKKTGQIRRGKDFASRAGRN